MKTTLFILLLTLGFTAVPTFAHADDENDACTPVFKACEAQGFARDKEAAPGKKIWADCADLIINKKQTVANVTLDPKVAAKCQKFKKDKTAFEKEWNEKNK